MKVLKFGGTSVGSAENIYKIKEIVESLSEEVIIVVSAFGGITDKLLKTAQLASEGDKSYKKELTEIIAIHKDRVNTLFSSNKEQQTPLMEEVLTLIEELSNIYRGLFLIKDLSPKTQDTIVSYGERLSSLIISKVITDCQLFDSHLFIKTEKQFNKHIVDFEKTNQLIQKQFSPLPQISLVPGFIASGTNDNEITNLGRGGSDYTAAIIAAALDAHVLEIWTDVDGFMTADPRIINSAYVIDKLSYIEAMELSHFGAKVVYPPTIYPVFHKNIPIRIKNTFNPEAPGSFISNKKDETKGKALIKGISSINDTCLITVQGLGMVGVIGVNSRIFNTLAENGISVFMVSQASSENNTTLAIRNEDAALAITALNEEFHLEQVQGEMNKISAEKGLATVAIVGEQMKHVPGIAGKLFGTLGKAGVSIIACAQGSAQTNISFVIKQAALRKVINSIHDSFFLSENKVLNLFIAGIGTVGHHLIEQIEQQQPILLDNHLQINVVGIAKSDKMLINRNGIDLYDYKKKVITEGISSSPTKMADHFIEMNIYNSVFVDCTANDNVAELYERFLKNNISVVAANKVAASSSYANYSNLKETAKTRGVKFLFETNVGAGLPIINTMNALLKSGDQIVRFEAVLSGTLNYIFNTLSENIPLSKAIMMAKDAGYAEPDPRIDLSGKDVIRKLVILAREAGYIIEQNNVVQNPFIPRELFEGSLDLFWEKIKSLDGKFEEKRKQLAKENKRYRFVAQMDHGVCQVGLQEVDSHHPFYELEGSNNIIMLSTQRYHTHPMIIKGYGAGAEVTAAGVFADIISIANI